MKNEEKNKKNKDSTIVIIYLASLVSYLITFYTNNQIYMIDDSIENKKLLNNKYKNQNLEYNLLFFQICLIILSLINLIIFYTSYVELTKHTLGILSSMLFYLGIINYLIIIYAISQGCESTLFSEIRSCSNINNETTYSDKKLTIYKNNYLILIIFSIILIMVSSIHYIYFVDKSYFSRIIKSLIIFQKLTLFYIISGFVMPIFPLLLIFGIINCLGECKCYCEIFPSESPNNTNNRLVQPSYNSKKSKICNINTGIEMTTNSNKH